jgi:hypothetical protein
VNIYVLEWIGAILSMLGTTLIGFGNRIAFHLWVVAGILMSIVAIDQELWGLLAMQIYCLAFNSSASVREIFNKKSNS